MGDLVVVGLLGLAGILVGGVYSTWKTARGLAYILIVLSLLSIGGAVAWYVSK